MITILRILRPIAAVVLFFVSWQFLMVSEFIAWAKQPPKPAATERRPTAAARHGKNLEEIERLARKVGAGVGDGAEVSADLERLTVLADELESLNAEIEDEFAATGGKLEEINAAPVIHERQRQALAGYREKFKELKRLLAALQRDQAQPSLRQKGAADLEAFLKANRPKGRHVPLDPNALPHRAAKAREILPKETQEEYDRDERFKDQEKPQNGWNRVLPKEGIQLASASGDLTGMFTVARAGASPAIPPPSPADLAVTIDAPFTDTIRAKAAELGNQPLAIYQWVRNNIEFVPSYGSIQGADYCLQTRQCNAFDTASLLIALLRVSGIHARYVYGTIDLPVNQAMNWVGGVEKPELAVQLLNMGGIPAVGVLTGSQFTKVRLEHVWVEAWVDYVPSRGPVHRQGDNWIPMDASWKQYTYTDGIDLATAVPFDAQGFVDQITSTATVNEAEGWATGIDSAYIGQQMDAYNTEVATYFTQNLPNATVADVLGSKVVIAENLPILASALPYRRVALAGRYADPPYAWRGKVTFSLPAEMAEEGPTFVAALPAIAGKRITLSFAPATAADQTLIESFVPRPHPDGTPVQLSEFPADYPAYLIQLKPELRIDGAVVASGIPATMGSAGVMSIALDLPGLGTDVIEKVVAAGEYFGVGVEVGRVGTATLDSHKARLEATKARLQAQDYAGLTKEDLLGDLLSTTIATYFGELDALDTVAARTHGVAAYRIPSVGLTYVAEDVQELFGMPLRAGSTSLVMDVVRIMQLALAKDGNPEKTKAFVLASGTTSSVLEHHAPERLFSQPTSPVSAISAVKALQMANDQGIPIYTVTQANVASVLPYLAVNGEVKTAIVNAVAAGREVTVSKTNISFMGWTGCGYIVTDPETGAAAYMISGALSGGKAFLWAAVLFFALAILTGGAIVFGALAATGAAMIGLVAVVAFFFVLGWLSIYGEIAVYDSVETANEYFQCLAGIIGWHAAGEVVEHRLQHAAVAFWRIMIPRLVAMGLAVEAAHTFDTCMQGLGK